MFATYNVRYESPADWARHYLRRARAFNFRWWWLRQPPLVTERILAICILVTLLSAISLAMQILPTYAETGSL